MPTADLIFKNAAVITVDAQQPGAEFVAIKGDKIIFAGAKDYLNDFTGPKTKFIDCAGKTLLPGFNDAHCHIFSLLRKLTSVELGFPKIKSINDIKGAIKKQVAKTPPGEWITGTDYNEFYLVEKRHPTRWEIDEVAPDNPVMLTHRSLHGCVLNSKALELAGITIETPEMPGTMIDRDVTRGGEPNGFLAEMVGYLREHVLPPISERELKTGIKLANEEYLSQGLTSLQDATVVNDMKRWQNYINFKNNGWLKSRVYMMTGIETMQEFRDAGLGFGAGDENLRLGAIKIVPSMIADKMYPSQEELNSLVLLTHQAGFQLAIHGVQTGMVDAIICSYEYLQHNAPDFSTRRHRIEHCSECPPDLMARLKKLQPIVVTHPSFTYFSGDRYLATVEKEVIPWLYRTGTLVKNGLAVAGGSDSPIVPNSPIIGIYGAVTRSTSSGQMLNPAEKHTAADVIKMYTLNAAYASHEENIKGSISTGKLADMVLLSRNPLQVPTAEIKDITVQMTVIGGKVVWEG
ncbi:MAG: amidohydrolase [Dehalococcoidales bacterium]